MKSKTFTIYLLNEGVKPTDALVNLDLLECESGATIPKDAHLYLTKDKTNNPWWKDYLGIKHNLKQSYPGGILFIPVGKRWFAATYGQSYHHLSSGSYEYDFGLKTALNAVDRKSLRSTDVVNPETAKRERVQAPKNSDLSFFSFDGDSNAILKRITGHVQEQYHDIFSCVTGCDSIRVTTKKSAGELVYFCEEILRLYSRDDAEKNFPEIFNIRPEKDPTTLCALDAKLLNALKNKDSNLILSYPDMLNYQNVGQIRFGSLKPANLYIIDSFWDSIAEAKLNALTVVQIKNTYNITIIDTDGNPISKTSPSLYKCLIFECELGEKHYHFCEGKWYCVNLDLVKRLRTQLNPYFDSESTLPANLFPQEADYNRSVAKKQSATVLFDRKDYYPKGQSQIELCDLCHLGKNDSVSLIHIKVGVHSSKLSHLFAQGYVGTRVLLSDNGAVEHFEKIINNSSLSDNDKTKILQGVKEKHINVIFGIITNKQASLKSDILPLFSRINLRHAIETLTAMNVNPRIQIIADEYIGKE